LATHTHGASSIIAIDHSPYMLGAARGLARSEGLDGMINFQEGNAEAIPFPDDSFDTVFSVTVMEELDADKMLSEMVRVTKPGGSVGVLVRAIDLPWHVNLTLPPDVKNRVETPGVFGSSMTKGGCADASLYTRFVRSGLTRLKMSPLLTAFSSGPLFQRFQSQGLSVLSNTESEVWEAAIRQAEGTFFIAQPFHCAVGTKP